MRVGVVQLCSGDDPAKNLPATVGLVRQAASEGATFVLTPEVTNCVSTSGIRQHEVLKTEAHDETLECLRTEAEKAGIWLLIGSLALKPDDTRGRFVNRSLLIDPLSKVAARYDKIHMFDVDVSETESYRESAGYRPGTKSVLANVDGTDVGLSICYDIRFPHLYRALAKAGARILTVPSAFSPVTGRSHWEVLLRARAIENGCFVIAPAQSGQNTPKRATYGHSLVISPWGEVIADGGTDPGITLVDLDLADVERSRQRIPSLAHDREFDGPA